MFVLSQMKIQIKLCSSHFSFWLMFKLLQMKIQIWISSSYSSFWLIFEICWWKIKSNFLKFFDQLMMFKLLQIIAQIKILSSHSSFWLIFELLQMKSQIKILIALELLTNIRALADKNYNFNYFIAFELLTDVRAFHFRNKKKTIKLSNDFWAFLMKYQIWIILSYTSFWLICFWRLKIKSEFSQHIRAFLMEDKIFLFSYLHFQLIFMLLWVKKLSKIFLMHSSFWLMFVLLGCRIKIIFSNLIRVFDGF